MFEYNTHHAKGLRQYFADAHRNGDIIEFGSVTFATTAELADGTNAIRAILVIADSMAQDEFECMFEDIHAHVEDIEQLFDIIADEFEIATAETEFVEFADGSVMVATVTATATDTETVTTRHADGTTTTARQTVADAHAVIAKGHATLTALAENGDIETDFADVHEFETLTETE
jgi:tRNA U34 5-methylaminomethyl-2-thiouridine-forming methyltransferase MnmC